MNKGWFRDSYRHSLAAQGITTKMGFSMPHDPIKKLKELEHESRVLRRKGIKIRANPRDLPSVPQQRFDQDQLEFGIQHEMQRGIDRQTATRMAVGNLIRDPSYYEKLQVRRQSMAYTPTYVVGDLPLIAEDAIGTAGATAVALAPLVVTAGVLYWGTKKVKSDYDKSKKELKKK